MTNETLAGALRDLAADVDAVAGPEPDRLWTGGRRRRWRAGAAGAATTAVVALVALFLAWPLLGAPVALPADPVEVGEPGARLTSYPERVAKPPFEPSTTRPGATALVLVGSELRLHAVSPTGEVTRLELPGWWGAESEPSSLSADGRWLAVGARLVDLTTGEAALPPIDDTRALADRAPTDAAALWSPDSSRAFVPGFDLGTPTSSGLVVGIDGSTTAAPLVDGGLVVTVAGWLDDRTVLALTGPGSSTDALELRTWTVGDDEWTDPGTRITWLREQTTGLRASLSPDRSRLLLTTGTSPEGTLDGEVTHTLAMVFDPRTGRQLGMPRSDGVLTTTTSGGFVGWQGWGCPAAWRDGLPVSTDAGRVAATWAGGGERLVSFSRRFGGEVCPAFAGDELRGEPVANRAAVIREWAWSYGLPAAGVLAVLGGVWWWSRRPRSPRRGPRDWVPVYLRPF